MLFNVSIVAGITSLGGMFCGFFVNHIDIAPTYAGTLMAITNTVATIPAIILPFFIDAMTQGNVSFHLFYTNFRLKDQIFSSRIGDNGRLENYLLCSDCILHRRHYCVLTLWIWGRGIVEWFQCY